MKYLVEPLPSVARGHAVEYRHRVAIDLLSRLVGHDVSVVYDDAGAPYIEGSPEVGISISHCATAIAVAVDSGGAVGIDIESRRKVSHALIGRVCTADECRLLHQSNDIEMDFLRLWTRKEAVLKQRRTGIRGFGSLIDATDNPRCTVYNILTGLPDVVAAVAYGSVARVAIGGGE